MSLSCEVVRDDYVLRLLSDKWLVIDQHICKLSNLEAVVMVCAALKLQACEDELRILDVKQISSL